MLEIHAGDLAQSAFDQLLGQETVACDTETSGLKWLVDELGIVQIYSPDTGTHIVQALQGHPATRLCLLLEDAGVHKIFHHAPFDLAFLKATYGVDVNNVSCTKIASKILVPSISTDHSLKALLKRHLGVSVSKGQVRTSDWTAQDLSVEQAEYAEQDVKFLIPLLESLEIELAKSNRLELFRDCCSFLPIRAKLDQILTDDVFAY